MCKFFSAIGLRDGSVLWHPMLDSHSDLLVYYGINDDEDYQSRFVKLELVPDGDWLDPETWEFCVDEKSAPVWCDEDRAAAFAAEMRRICRGFIIRDGEKRIIVDGCWIVGGTASVYDVRAGRIIRVEGSASIKDVRGSASIQNVCGSASILNVRDSASIQDVSGSVSIRGVWESASIRDVRDSVSIRDVRGSASICNVSGSASIRGVWGSASIQNVWGSASIQEVWVSASILDVGINVTLDESAKRAVRT